MNIRPIAFCMAVGLLLATSESAMAWGGAKIVVRQHSYSGVGLGPVFGNGVVGNWLMNEGDMVLRDLLRGGNSTATGLPPAQSAPTPDPKLGALLDRLDRLNGVPPQSNQNQTLTPVTGGPIPKPATDLPSVVPE